LRIQDFSNSKPTISGFEENLFIVFQNGNKIFFRSINVASVQKIALQNEIDRNSADIPSPIVDNAKSTKNHSEPTPTPDAGEAPTISMDKLV
jgi:hypothetical protein